MLFLLAYLSSVDTVITLLPNFFHLVCTMGEEYIKAVYYNPAFFNYMQNTLCEMLDCMKHRLQSRWPGEISIISYMHMTPSYGRKQRRTKEPLDESESGK